MIVEDFPGLGDPADSVRKFYQVTHQQRRPGLPDFADEHFQLVAESSGIPGNWRTFPYQRAIMHVMSDDDIRFVAVQKCTRIGYTKMKVTAELRAAADLKRNVLCYQPSDEDADGYYKDEIQPAIDASEVFRSQLRANHAYEKSPHNTSSRIAFYGGVIHNLGGASTKNYRRRTGDLVTMDEIDELDQNIGRQRDNKQGGPIELAARALTDSPFAKQIIGSSPTRKGRSIVENQIDLLDHVFSRYIPCPNCNDFTNTAEINSQHLERIPLLMGDSDTDYGLKCCDNNINTTQYLCPMCSALFDWQAMQDMDEYGEYRSESGLIIRDSDGVFTDKHYTEVDKPFEVGFRLNALISRFISWPEIMNRYLKAKKEANGGDFNSMITFRNHIEGETWEEVDHATLNSSEFETEHQIKYAAELPAGVKVVVFGADLASTHLDITFFGYGLEEVCWAIKHQRIYGDIETDYFWNQVQDCIDQWFQSESGGKLQAFKGVIDAGHSHAMVTRFCKRQQNKMRVFAGKGLPAQLAQQLYTWPTNTKGGYFLVRTGGDTAMETLRQRWVKKIRQDGVPKPGQVFYPKPVSATDKQGFDNDYFSQLIADRKIEKRSLGRMVSSWEPPGKKRNDAADCARLAFIAFRIATAPDLFNLKLDTVVPAKPTQKQPAQQNDVYSEIERLASNMNNGTSRNSLGDSNSYLAAT